MAAGEVMGAEALARLSHCISSQESEWWMLVLRRLLFVQSRAPVVGVMLPTFRVGLPVDLISS